MSGAWRFTARSSALILCLVALSGRPCRGGVRVLPIFNGSLSGGSSKFEGARSAFRGNAQAEFIPVLQFTGKTSLMPIFKARYAGTQSAVQVIDEGSLFQQQQDYGSELRWIRRLGRDWKWVASGGGTWTFYRETADEKKWGRGLYDNRVFYGGTSLEKKFPDWKRPTLFRAGLEISKTLFPNYRSLASQQQGGPFTGTDILDVNSASLSLKGETSLRPQVYLEYGITAANNAYLDQRIAADIDRYSEEKRADGFFLGNVRADWFLSPWDPPFLRWWKGGSAVKTNIALEFRWKSRASNQNFVDTGALKFFPNYYSYNEYALAPAVHFRFDPSDLVWSLGMEAGRRDYVDRPVQEDSGVYSDGTKLHTKTFDYFTRISYPFSKHARAYVSADYHKAASNNGTAETLYKYDFSSSQYSLGISVEY